MGEHYKASLSTLVYIEDPETHQILMLHRVKKHHDVNHGKWIGIGGHFEKDESPEDCLLREVREETGLTLTKWHFQGIVTFISGDGVTEYMHLYTSDAFTGTLHDCDEGELKWVPKEEVLKLNLWEGDRIFFRLILEDPDFFSLKLVYDGNGRLCSAVQDGRDMELFDVLDESGQKTGIVRERNVCHRDGSLHGTVHIWFLREHQGKWQVLLQKRSAVKNSNPGRYDISSAGHIPSGETPIQAAVREVGEELGLNVVPSDLIKIGTHRAGFSARFHGKPFVDQELSTVYLCFKAFDLKELKLQESEVALVKWFDLKAARQGISDQSIPNCIHMDEFDMVKDEILRGKGKTLAEDGKGFRYNRTKQR